MKKFSLIAIGVLGLVSPAVARGEIFSSLSGQTTFQVPTATACYGGDNRVIRYNTTYKSIPYEGYFWVRNVSGCNTPNVRIQGYFEERNQAQNHWYKGSLALQLNGARGTARWQNVNTQPGYRCSGSGQSFDLQLVRTSP
jgi:hypothetical protein